MKKINAINIYFWFFQIKLIDRDEKKGKSPIFY